MLKFLSLAELKGNKYKLPARIPNTLNNMTSLQILDLHNRLLSDLPLRQNVMSSSYLESLISLDLGYCQLREIPDSIGELSCLERLNLEGNNFRSLPNSIKRLLRLAHLNLTRCCDLRALPELQFDSDTSGGRYFQSVSTSRNHRSGLHLYDCHTVMNNDLMQAALSWLARLVEHPCHFRCGFEILVPAARGEIPEWFNHRFEGGSSISILDSGVDDNWIGFAFCVTFEVNETFLGPFPLHLSFENENTEECFDAPPYLDYTEKFFDAPTYLDYTENYEMRHDWIIYISRVHCHFLKTGARIGFKADSGLKIHEWGLRMIFKQDIEMLKRKLYNQNEQEDDFYSHRLVIEKMQKSSSSSSEPKIRLPYNWLVSDEEEGEKMEAKIKEDNLSNAGLTYT